MAGVITFKQKGDFRKLNSFLERCLNVAKLGELDKYGRKGVEVLRDNTPIDTGIAANSWRYEIERTSDGVCISWCNDDIEGGYNVAILIEYGHGTGTGGYVVGRHFISPAIQPIFDELADAAWKELSGQ